MKLGVTKTTSRGFAFVEFSDLYGAKCSLQESSLATDNAIWLGCDHETIHDVTGERCGARMHLNEKQVRALIYHLQTWLDTGEFNKAKAAKKGAKP